MLSKSSAAIVAVSIASFMLICTILPAQGGEIIGQDGMFPFLVPSVSYFDNPTDMSHLNDTPAGGSGFIHVEGGHFIDGNGQRIRFIGGALCWGACFPSHDDAEKLAQRLAMCGFNLVRLHHFDRHYAPRGIWDADYDDKQHIDPRQLDRLDYLIHCLKRQGVYTNINLHVSRSFGRADGFSNIDSLPKYDKGVDNFVPRMIKLQRKYARQLLTHKNPYTETRYVDEPAVAFVEINNENSLVKMILRGQLANLGEYYERHLTGPWNDWLKERYATDENLREQWDVIDRPAGEEMLQNTDFTDGAKHWTLERNKLTEAATRENGGPDGGPCLHLRFIRPGDVPWSMQMHQTGLEFEDGEPYTTELWMRGEQPAKVGIIARLDHAHPETGRYEVIGLNRSFQVTKEWQHFKYTFVAEDPSDGGNRIGFTFPNEKGEFYVANFSLRPGGHVGLRKDASLENGNIGRPFKRTSTEKQWYDWVRFVAQLERDYATDMYKFLKDDLGVKCPVIDTQASYGGIIGLYREAQLDYSNMHAYWQHPHFPAKSWDINNWVIGNSPMIGRPQRSTVMSAAHHSIHNRPLLLSEFNHPTPSYYAAECWPVTASFFALQDFDGLVVHNYLNYGDDWDQRHWNHFFDTATNPQKAPFVAAAAVMLREGYVSAAKGRLKLRVPEKKIYELAANDKHRLSYLWQQAGLNWKSALTHRLSVEFIEGDGEIELVKVSPNRQPTDNEVRWQAKPAEEALYTVNTAKAKAAIGYLSGRQINLQSTQIAMGTTPTGFAAITLVSLDGRPISRSRDLLLSAAGRAANKNWNWSEDGAMLKDFGGNPTLAEGIPATIGFATDADSVEATALDGAGNPKGDAFCQLTGGTANIKIGPEYRTLWYHISCSQ